MWGSARRHFYEPDTPPAPTSTPAVVTTERLHVLARRRLSSTRSTGARSHARKRGSSTSGAGVRRSPGPAKVYCWHDGAIHSRSRITPLWQFFLLPVCWLYFFFNVSELTVGFWARWHCRISAPSVPPCIWRWIILIIHVDGWHQMTPGWQRMTLVIPVDGWHRMTHGLRLLFVLTNDTGWTPDDTDTGWPADEPDDTTAHLDGWHRMIPGWHRMTLVVRLDGWRRMTPVTPDDTTYNNNGLFDLAVTAGLDTQNTYTLHIEPKYKKNKKIQSNVQQYTWNVVHHSSDMRVHQLIIAAVLQHYW